MLKRTFDLVVAAIALALLAPIFLLIGVCIRADSPGPVFFTQPRVGRHGVPFTIFKFRTMVDRPAARGLGITVGADPRITRVGAWLRRTKLDELPQLLNVLVGHMSIVGPRPELARYVDLYPQDLARKILSVRPGITDEAAIEFSDEASLLAQAADPESFYISEVLPQKVRLYAKYAQNHGLVTDFVLIFKTLRKLILTSR